MIVPPVKSMELLIPKKNNDNTLIIKTKEDIINIVLNCFTKLNLKLFIICLIF